jgi:tetratricopeptide (TPR) repeat protein
MKTRAGPSDCGRKVRPVHIVRDPHAVPVTAYYFRDFATLARDAAVDDLSTQGVFADLSCGPWRGHWLARELCPQLGLDEPEPVYPNPQNNFREADAYADKVASLTDAESGGDRNFAAAYEYARRIAARVRACGIRRVFVVAPRAQHIWGAENLFLLGLLGRAARAHDFELWCLSGSGCALGPVEGIEWVPFNRPDTHAPPLRGCQLPGLVSGAWLIAAGSAPSCLPVRGDRLLISPNARQGELNAAQRRRLRTLALPAHLLACLELHEPTPRPALLCAAAGQCFAEGGHDAALAMLDRMKTGSLSGLQRATFESYRQSIAIALMKFERAAQGALPEGTIPDVVKASLYQSKGWGLVMTRRPHEADEYFERARAHFDTANAPRLTSYLLNISALAKLRCGDTGAALALECEIEARLRELPRCDWHLVYINCLNLARIYKRIGDLGRAEQYYRRAFFVTAGVRTESDLLYMNLCHARLAQLRGDTGAAFRNTLRAAIHWLSNPLPEALAPRVAQAVAGNRTGGGTDVEQVSLVLEQMLLNAAELHGADVRPVRDGVSFNRLTRPRQAAVYAVHDGWAIALSQRKPAAPAFRGVRYDALKRTVTGVLAGQFSQIDFSCCRRVLSDARFGIELPSTAREACWSSYRYGIRELLRAGQRYRLSAETGELGRFVVQRGAAVASIARSGGRVTVGFKRYLAPLGLDDGECSILACLDEPITVAQLAERVGWSISVCVTVIRLLEERHVIAVA